MHLKILFKKVPHPTKPQNVTGVFNADGSVSLTWGAVEDAQSYIVHYGNANQSDPHQATMMGYTETSGWNLESDNVPSLLSGDSICFYVQAYKALGVGADEVEKARYLHDGSFTGSSWSTPIILTKD